MVAQNHWQVYAGSWAPAPYSPSMLGDASGTGGCDGGPTLVAAPPLVTADGLWWWTGYGWAPTLAALAFQESERRRRLQSWLNIGAAVLLFLR
jgi:hypothetical protein